MFQTRFASTWPFGSAPGAGREFLRLFLRRENLFPNKYTDGRDRILVSYHCRFNEMLLTLAYVYKLLLYNKIFKYYTYFFS